MATTKAVTSLVLPGGLLAIPVSLNKIKTTSDVSFESASPDGNPLKQVQVDIHTGAVVESDEVRKGIFGSKPKSTDKSTWSGFREISAEDRSAIDDATKLDDMQIDYFIPLSEVPWERVSDAYFLAPAKGLSAKPLVLLAKTLAKTKRAGVFKLSKTTRQYLAVVYAKNGGLMVNTLCYSGDFTAAREASESLAAANVKVHAKELELAEALVRANEATAHVLDGYADEALPLRAELVEKALSGKPVKTAKTKTKVEPPSDGLEELLRSSVAKAASGAKGKDKVPAGV